MTEGFKQAGYNVIGAIEIDPTACMVYALNHPGVRLWPLDIRQIKISDLLTALNLEVGELDLLGGCPPCQGFSTLRTYNGGRQVRDELNDLIFEFQRQVLGLKQKNLMLENVPGLFKDHRMTEFIGALADEGYQVKADVLNAVHYGVPQRRRRVVMLASRVSEVRFAQQARKCRNVRDVIGSLPRPGKSRDPLHNIPESRSNTVRDLIRAIPRNGGSRKALPHQMILSCHKKSDGFRDVYGRMAWDKPAPTITTGCFNPSKGRFLHPTENRAITMREAALLQSFPKSYRFPPELGKVKIAMMIGNALPPELIRRLAKQLMRDNERQSPTEQSADLS
jgi:DNA (cytosine-5)-methyltransferase 1